MRRGLMLFFVVVMLALPLAASAASAVDLLSQGRADDALSMLKSQVQASPSDAEIYHLLCRTYFAEQRWDDAIAAGERAIALDPKNSYYHMWLGRAYGEKAGAANFITAMGLTKKVRTEFEKAVELDANNTLARTDLAEFYLEAPGFLGGGRDKAMEQARQLAPHDAAGAHWVQAVAAEKEKNNTLAEQEFKAAIDASHGEATFWLNLASFYRKLGRLQDMQSAISSAIAANKKKPVIFFDAAQLLFRAGQVPQAVELLKKYLTQETPEEEGPAFQAHYLLGAMYEKQGDKQAAVEQYRAALSLARDYGRAQEALKRLDPKALP